VAGARALVLLAPEAPTAAARAALAAAVAAHAPGARLAVAVVGAHEAARPALLLRALYTARPAGAGRFAGALLPSAPDTVNFTASERLGIPRTAPADTARAVVRALGRWARVVDLQECAAGALEAASCFVLPVADGTPVEEQVGMGRGGQVRGFAWVFKRSLVYLHC
jgi:hypothetical protein